MKSNFTSTFIQTKPSSKRIQKTILPCLFAASCLLIPVTGFGVEFAGTLDGVSITDAEGNNTPPTASFTYTVDGNDVTFDASDSIDPDGSIIKYMWNFGDNSTATGINTTHTYVSKNNMSATLTTVDNGNAFSLTQQTIANASCSETPFLEIAAQTGNRQLISNDKNAYLGGQYTGNSFTLCKVSFLIRTWIGIANTDTRTYEVRIYSTTNGNLGNLKGTSEKISGNNFDDQIRFHDFSFSSPVEVISGDAIVLTETTQTVDTTSFIRAYYDNQSNPSISMGTWHSSGTNSYFSSASAPSIRIFSYK